MGLQLAVMTTKVYGVKCKTEGCEGTLPMYAPAKAIFTPNVIVTGTCKKCRKKNVYEESDVIQLGQITTTENAPPRRKK